MRGYARCACIHTRHTSRVCMRVFGVFTHTHAQAKVSPEEAYLMCSHTCTRTHAHIHLHTHTQVKVSRQEAYLVYSRTCTHTHTNTHTHTTQVKVSRQEAFQELGILLFGNVLYTATSCRKYTRALTFLHFFLGIVETASEDEIRAAYKKLAREVVDVYVYVCVCVCVCVCLCL